MLFKRLQRVIQRLTDWEHWPFYVFYFPISYAWVFYYLRSRSLWFFTASNPTLSFGGFEGVGKSEMYRQLPSRYCAPSIFVSPDEDFDIVMQLIAGKGLRFPLVVKPDIGMKGILFRKIDNACALQSYHRQMPVRYVIQPFIDAPVEVSVFYCRSPKRQTGEITALIEKKLPVVYGDGSSTLEKLICSAYPSGKIVQKMKLLHPDKIQKVLPKNESCRLSHVANLMHGSEFSDLHHLVDDRLTTIFDRISHHASFYYGRYDIKCRSVNDLWEEKFIILEFNGAGSVPNHIYTGGYTLGKAYAEILKHWKAMFMISRINHQKGFTYWSLMKGHKFLKNSRKHFDRLKKLDPILVV